MREVTDDALIRRIVKFDDRAAFATLVRRYQCELRNSLTRMCQGDRALADDLSQEVFIKVYRYLRAFKGNSSFRTWLYRIAWNTFLNECKKKSLDYFPDVEEALEADHNNGLTRYGAQRDIEKALARLNDVQRLVIDLNLQRGFSHQEIVNITGMPLGTVKSHIQRARGLLQSLLADWVEA